MGKIKPARKLPHKIAHRWKLWREKESAEETKWKEVEDKNEKTPVVAMLAEPSGRKGKRTVVAEIVKNKKSKKQKPQAWT